MHRLSHGKCSKNLTLKLEHVEKYKISLTSYIIFFLIYPDYQIIYAIHFFKFPNIIKKCLNYGKLRIHILKLNFVKFVM